MTSKISLYSSFLRYEADIVLHTALSGPVPGISSLYVVIEKEGGFCGVSETRANMEYYNGLREDLVPAVITGAISEIRWNQSIDAITEHLNSLDYLHPVARCAIEGAILDGQARQNRLSVAELLGGTWQSHVETNNSLMWTPFDKFERLVDRFLDDGFKTLKVRIAVDKFEEDLRRVKYLEKVCAGSPVRYGVDVNCRWSTSDAIERINILCSHGVSFVEQPTAAGDWDALTALAEQTSVPIIVDEGCQSKEDIERLAQLGPPFMVHLKMLKMGGPRNMVSYAKKLLEHGVQPIMGQMNEGMAATALAAQCAMTVASKRPAELYGFYGLLNEPVSGLHYDNGSVVIPNRLGAGFIFDRTSLAPLFSLSV